MSMYRNVSHFLDEEQTYTVQDVYLDSADEDSSSEDDEGDYISPALYFFAKYLTIYLQPVICAAGLVGNFVSFCVFIARAMRKISSNLYLAGLLLFMTILFRILLKKM